MITFIEQSRTNETRKELQENIQLMEAERDKLLQTACIYIFLYGKKSKERIKIKPDYSDVFKYQFPSIYVGILKSQIDELNLAIACSKPFHEKVMPM